MRITRSFWIGILAVVAALVLVAPPTAQADDDAFQQEIAEQQRQAEEQLRQQQQEQERQRAESAGMSVRFLVADVLHPPPELDGPFDFFFDRGCYHVVRREDVAAYLETLRRLTRSGSWGLVLAGNAREPHDPGPPVVSEEQMRSELGSVFEIVQLREFRFDQVEADGTRFLGWSCLLQRQDP